MFQPMSPRPKWDGTKTCNSGLPTPLRLSSLFADEMAVIMRAFPGDLSGIRTCCRNVTITSSMPSEPKPRTGSAAPPLGSDSNSGSLNLPNTKGIDGLDAFLGRWKVVAGDVESTLVAAIERLGNDCPVRLRDAIAYSLLAPGKRLRPILCVFACEAVGGDLRAAVGPAAALEMIHCYSLIHDDLPAMDDDDLRRGRPTCHIQFDEATAILAGDALQPLAF